MALILNIETSTSVCSVALARDGKMIALKENNEGLNHSVLLGTYIDEILKDNHMDAHCLDAVAISMGPGVVYRITHRSIYGERSMFRSR